LEEKGEGMKKKHPSHVNNVTSLRRIEGQVRGIQRMIEKREYCVDILNQIHAVMGALARVEDKIFEKHLGACVTEAIRGTSKAEKNRKLNEVLTLLKQARRI